VLSHYTVGSTLTRSEQEEALLRLCDDHGLPRPETNVRIEGIECDAVWRDARLIVEVDGYKYHRIRSVFVSDRERDVVLKLAGWTVLRFAYEHITERGAWVAAAIRGAMADRGGTGRRRRARG
jgi:very-short-patch-repair endonuclease